MLKVLFMLNMLIILNLLILLNVCIILNFLIMLNMFIILYALIMLNVLIMLKSTIARVYCGTDRMYQTFVDHQRMTRIRERTVWIHVDVPGQGHQMADLPNE